MTQDFNFFTDLTSAATPAYSYIETDERVIVHAGVLIGSGTDALFSGFALSKLVNSGDINSGTNAGVRFSALGDFIQNNAGATIVGANGIQFDTGAGDVTNHGIVKGLATGDYGITFNNITFTQIVTNDGLIFGRTYGIGVYGDTINNHAGGLITAYSGTAILVGQSFNVRTTINNAAGATIKGALAIDGSGQDDGINLNNHGSIIGSIHGGDGTLSTNTDRIFNHHLIQGGISLGIGNDLYDGHDGKVTGKVSGGDGNDRLIGGAAAEVLAGGDGKDTLTGNGGGDKFLFNTLPNSATNFDVITDFNPAQGDRIDLSKADFPGIGPVGTLLGQFFRAAPHAATASQHILYNQATGALFYDQDGKGTAHAPIHFATLSTHPVLVAGDFIVVA